MSEFSDFCSMLREESGMTIYHIAKVSGMERTALNRMLNGKRFPKYEDVELFCEVLRAGERDKEHLRELYLMEKMGRNHYENYIYIRNLLRELDQRENDAAFPDPSGTKNTDSREKSFVNGKREVRSMICSVLEGAYRQEKIQEMYTNFPVQEKILFTVVECCEKKYRREIPLCHFHILNINPEKYYDVTCNLKVLRAALMWLFTKGESYIPYYTYSQLMLDDLELQFMPYYLVSASRVLLVSDDFRQGILLEDEDMVVFYRNRMEMIRRQMHHLVQTYPEKAGVWEDDTVLRTLDAPDLELQHLEVMLYGKGVVLSKDRGAEQGRSVRITESSLYESFHHFFDYLSEMSEIEGVRGVTRN